MTFDVLNVRHAAASVAFMGSGFLMSPRLNRRNPICYSCDFCRVAPCVCILSNGVSYEFPSFDVNERHRAAMFRNKHRKRKHVWHKINPQMVTRSFFKSCKHYVSGFNRVVLVRNFRRSFGNGPQAFARSVSKWQSLHCIFFRWPFWCRAQVKTNQANSCKGYCWRVYWQSIWFANDGLGNWRLEC